MGISMQFGDLNFQFTDEFRYAWKDEGSRGRYDGSFWTPISRATGYRPLGGIGFHGYSDPNGNQWALCVAGAVDDAVAAPIGYERIWKDTDSGADDDGSCWRPIPPNDGYKACGDIFMRGHDTPPPTTAVWCVRKDLVHSGVVGDLIWNNADTDSAPFGAWQIDTPVPYVDAECGLFAAHTYVGVPSQDPPRGGVEVNVLQVPVPVTMRVDPAPPVLTSYDSPPLETEAVIDRIVTVPFTAISDQNATISYQVTTSPFYTITRTVYYSLFLFANNQTSTQQTKSRAVAVGITNTQTEAFASETAVTVGFESGVALGEAPFVYSGKVSASITQRFGYQQSTSVAEFESVTLNDLLMIPPKHAAASWGLTYALQVFRGDGSAVSLPLIFNDNGSFVDSQFPFAEKREGALPSRPKATA